jgi:hypothetical protein
MSDRALCVNPAVDRFAAGLGAEQIVAQVHIARSGEGFDLRHTEDCGAAPDQLRLVTALELRQLAQFTARGAFRPLKGAPDLRRGWCLRARDAAALGEALDQVYPGFVADWHALRFTRAPVTHYRDFAARQTGMYRICATLTDHQAARIAGACCHPRFCLKQRLWVAGDAPADDPAGKSLIPCLEPCAVLMEFARKAARIEQEEPVASPLHPEEITTLRAALEAALATPPAEVRIADFSSPLNPRRVALALSKLPSAPVPASEE